MHIAILGGSGRMGQELIREALYREYQVTTLVRHPSKIPMDLADAVDIIQGDATSTTAIQQVLYNGVDVLIHAVSVPLWHHKPTDLYSSVTQTVIDAWGGVDHICQRYIVMSSFGTHHGRQLPRPFDRGYEYVLGDVADDKEREEGLLEQSSLPWTVIKAVVLTDHKKTTYSRIPFADFVPSPRKRISRPTVASAIIDSIQRSGDIGEKIVVT